MFHCPFNWHCIDNHAQTIQTFAIIHTECQLISFSPPAFVTNMRYAVNRQLDVYQSTAKYIARNRIVFYNFKFNPIKPGPEILFCSRNPTRASAFSLSKLLAKMSLRPIPTKFGLNLLTSYSLGQNMKSQEVSRCFKCVFLFKDVWMSDKSWEPGILLKTWKIEYL